MVHYRHICLIACLLLCVQLGKASATEEDKAAFIMASVLPKHSPGHKWWVLIYSELFKRLDIPLIIRFIPSKRATIEAEAGNIDGQLARVYEYQEMFPDQLRINVSIHKIKVLAYVRRGTNIKLDNGWDSLKGTTYHIEYRRGAIFIENNLKRVVEPDRLSAIGTGKQGFLKLRRGRTDVFIHTAMSNWPYTYSVEFKNDIVSSGLMAEIELFPYIHKKHKALIPRMEETLESMKKEGVIEKYCWQTFSSDAVEICGNLD